MQSLFSQSPKKTNENSKHFKFNSDSSSDSFPQTKQPQIKPIPFLYKKIAYEEDPKRILKMTVRAYKYVSRIVASGEHTVDILNHTKKTSSLKLVKKIECDPYFCKNSAIKALAKILKRFGKQVDSLNLTLRSTETRYDAMQFSCCLARLSSLTKLKITVPNNSDIDFETFRLLTRGCSRFYSLKSSDIGIGATKDISQNLSQIGNVLKNSLKVEKTNCYIFFTHAQPSPDENVKETKIPRKSRVSPQLKSIAYKFTFKTGWASYFDGVSVVQGFNSFLKVIPNYANPIHFSLTFDKMHMPLDTLQTFADVIPRLTNLRHVFLELNNMKLTEFELMILAKGFVDCKQIEHLTFKYLDNVIIPRGDVLKFITILAKFSVFPKFDLLFRKLFYSEWQTPEAKRELDGLESIQYVLTKQSIHIQKGQEFRSEILES